MHIPIISYHNVMFEWHKQFKDGCESVKDEPLPGRPQTARTDSNCRS